MEAANVLIAGGGIIGTGIAWALARRGIDGIVVVDLDLAGLYASSELNAGGARASWWQPVNIATCTSTLEFFRTHSEEFGFHECGYLWLYDDGPLFERARRKTDLQNEFGLGIETLSVGRPVIVGGDYNLDYSRHGDRAMQLAFRERLGLLDSGAGPELPFWKERDYVLYRSGDGATLSVEASGEAIEFVNRGRALSDHPALYARFRLEAASP